MACMHVKQFSYLYYTELINYSGERLKVISLSDQRPLSTGGGH